MATLRSNVVQSYIHKGGPTLAALCRNKSDIPMGSTAWLMASPCETLPFGTPKNVDRRQELWRKALSFWTNKMEKMKKKKRIMGYYGGLYLLKRLRTWSVKFLFRKMQNIASWSELGRGHCVRGHLPYTWQGFMAAIQRRSWEVRSREILLGIIWKHFKHFWKHNQIALFSKINVSQIIKYNIHHSVRKVWVIGSESITLPYFAELRSPPLTADRETTWHFSYSKCVECLQLHWAGILQN